MRVAPVRFAIRADSSVCSGVSTAHGPAMKVKVSGPIGTPPTRIVVRLSWFCAETSLYGAVMRIVSATPGSPSTWRVSRTSSVPTTPMIVRITPRLTKACPWCASMWVTMPSMSASVAPGAITMTMASSLTRVGRALLVAAARAASGGRQVGSVDVQRECRLRRADLVDVVRGPEQAALAGGGHPPAARPDPLAVAPEQPLVLGADQHGDDAPRDVVVDG